MIPKKIHYCWLSNEVMPENIQICIRSWKEIMPDYELVLWDTNRFNIDSNQFVKEACLKKKWAFAADYIRIYALYTEGGIYLDSDVLVKKRFDEFLTSGFFTAMEYHQSIVDKENTLNLLNDDGTSKSELNKRGIGIQAAVLGGVKGHSFLEDCLNFYKTKHFILDNGKIFNEFIAPGIYAMIAEIYGFRYIDEKQYLKNNILILTSDVFAGLPSYEKSTSYAIHNCNGSWREHPKLSLAKRLKSKILKTLPNIVYKKLLVLAKSK
jgi:mannosyltransferase OCH1-like enzyme